MNLVNRNPEVDKAKRMYMAGLSLPNIQRLVNIPPPELQNLVMGIDGTGKSPDCWYAQKVGISDEVVVAASLERLDFTLKCTGLASAVLHESLVSLNAQVKSGGRTLTIKEMESVTNIVEKLDKIVRLEKGSPTEIISKAGLSVEEAREILKNDPFAPKIIDAEVTDVVVVDPIAPVAEDDLLG